MCFSKPTIQSHYQGILLVAVRALEVELLCGRLSLTVVEVLRPVGEDAAAHRAPDHALLRVGAQVLLQLLIEKQNKFYQQTNKF